MEDVLPVLFSKFDLHFRAAFARRIPTSVGWSMAAQPLLNCVSGIGSKAGRKPFLGEPRRTFQSRFSPAMPETEGECTIFNTL